jgi:hypothetical protein
MAGVSKKETAKVNPPPSTAKPGLPQATVQLSKKPEPPSASKSVSAPAISVIKQAEPSSGGGEISPVIGGLALGISLLALLVQVWMLLS